MNNTLKLAVFNVFIFNKNKLHNIRKYLNINRILYLFPNFTKHYDPYTKMFSIKLAIQRSLFEKFNKYVVY